MTDDANNARPAEDGQIATEPSGPAQRHRRRALQSGYSLLARGEPQIWLIGGMLVVCLAMIISLLTLVLYRGLPSFWPKQVDWLVLSDGTQEIGQPQARRKGDANKMVLQMAAPDEGADSEGADSENSQRQATEASPASENESAASTASDDDTYSSYYRTGNYRLSQVHYRWMDSELLQDNSVSTPPWAAVVERLEWGRFYGIPLLASRKLALPEKDAAKLERLKELQSALQTANANAEGEVIAQALTALDTALNIELRRSVQAAVAEANGKLADNEFIQVASSEDGPWSLAKSAAAQPDEDQDAESAAKADAFTAARIVRRGRAATTKWLQSVLPSVVAARRELEDLRFKVSRMDLRISELRVDIRRAELATVSRSTQQPDAIHFQLEERVRVQKQIELLKELLASQDTASEESGFEVEGLQSAAELAAKEALPTTLENINAEIDDWLKLSSAAAQPIQDALRDYCDGYSAVFESKIPLQSRIEQLERELAEIDAVFSVPNGATALDGSLAAVAEEIASGSISQASLDALAEAGIQLQAGSEEITVISDSLAMLDAVDSTGAAISLSSALASDAQQRSLINNTTETIAAEQIVRLVSVNQLGLGQKWSVYLDRWWEFLTENPREANSEGGVFPVIWGTIVMTLLMTIAVVPFGVMAALYLREYAGSGPLVSVIRISINNLAGVPSIVYGVFGFSFFCYTIGAYVDGGPKNADITPWPSNLWFVCLALTACTGTAAFFFSFFYTGSPQQSPKMKRFIGRFCLALWLVSIALIAALILKSPFFDGFYQAYLPNPTFGKGGLLWGALTLALLTLPVVIVATEEALAAVPNSLREGSLACGASKWQTIRRIILPHARPGILTGAILAMARGAGEVAPLMLVGALPSAPDLPVDTEFPFFHLSRSFMHLGYQIYVMGFQSQNSDAAVPLVFTCTLLLISIVAALNLVAIFLRSRLKRRFQGNQF